MSRVAHTTAVRKLRRLAREHGCMVVIRPMRTDGHDHDVYQVIDHDTGRSRGEVVARHRALDKVDLDEFFATELVA